MIEEIIKYARELQQDPALALQDYYEEKGSAKPITYQRAQTIVKGYLQCQFCGNVFKSDDPDVTLDACDDDEFLVTCENPSCVDQGFFWMGWVVV